MNLKWHQLKEHLETLSEEDLKGDVLISNPSDKLHVCTCIRRAHARDVFSKGTLFLRAGKKRYRYWIAENNHIKTVYVCRGTDSPDEYKVLKVRSDIWVEELKGWQSWDSLAVNKARGVFGEKVEWEEVDEKIANHFLDLARNDD